MNRERFESLLAPRLGRERLIANAPLAPLTTFKVGGPADWLVDVRTAGELVDLLAAARESNVPLTILGGGSNVLIGDRGIRGAVVRLRLSAVSQPARRRLESLDRQ